MSDIETASDVGEREWKQTTRYEYREAPYALQSRVTKEQWENGDASAALKTSVEYEYDNSQSGYLRYGNVTEIRDTGEGLPELRAKLTWWHNDDRYYHGHPAAIAVYSGDRLIRERRGEYNRETGALEKQVQSGLEGSREGEVTTVIRWDGYGNLQEIRNGEAAESSWVRYVWDEKQGQYPVEIQRGGGTGIGPYRSFIDWDYRLGVKTKETDENGESVTYRYDEYGRLLEVRTGHDVAGSPPAVSYEYGIRETNGKQRWYAVTGNKVSYDRDDVIRTVIVSDGLGRALVTAKEGSAWNGNGETYGWNVAGLESIDMRGRSVSKGQSVFVPGVTAETLVGWSHPREDGRYGMRYPTLTSYDSQDRVTETLLPDTENRPVVQTTRYRIEGRRSVVDTTDPLGNRSVARHDARGNVVAVERYGKDGALLTSAGYSYNGIGELETAKDHDGNELRVAYDLAGRRVLMESADIGTKAWHYDEHGNVAWETDSVLAGKGTRIEYEYDEMNRLKRIVYPESEDTEYGYGEPNAGSGRANRIAWVSDESGRTEYEYGKLGETTREIRTIAHLDAAKAGTGTTRSVGYRSNYLGQLEALVFEAGTDTDTESVEYGYNSAGQVTTVTGRKGTRNFEYVKKTGYDEFGQRVYIDYGNGVTTRYTYDPARRWLTSVRSTGPQGLTYQDIGYSFDAVGNVLGYENKAAGYETAQKYTYDGLYQLVKAEGDSIGRSGAGTGLYDYETHYEQAFSFDMIGNMTEKKSRTRSPYANPPGVNLDYESQYTYKKGTHQAIQIGSARYEYDGNGNVILERYGNADTPTGNKKTHEVHEEDGVYSTDYGFALTLGSTESGSANTERRYVWNERNLLKRSSDGQYAVEYRYGADGQRAIKYVVKQGGSGERTETLYYNKWYQLVSTNDNLRMVESKHIYVGETRIATKQRHDDNSNYSEELKHTYYYHGDHLGSAQVVTNGSGEIYEHIEYTPYGELWVDHTKRIGSEEGTPFRFTGKEYDEETGLYYYGARYLDPKTSRWISTDPAMGEYIPQAGKGSEGLPGLGGIYNTINMHTYHYAGNNPVNQTDPDGRDIEVNANDNGTYTVTGGTLNPDRNIYIMKDGERTGEVLGQTLTDFSFFGDDGVLVKDAIIDPNDNSGQAFIDEIKSNTPGLIKYAFNAGNTKKYDFKSRGGDSRGNHYRGMPIKDANGNTVYASARDVGNYGAGFVAGRNLLPWFATRVGFDFYQTISNDNLFHSWDEESINSQEAQRAGFGVGANLGIKDLNNRLRKDYNYFYHNNYGRN